MRTCLVLGGAQSVWDDIENATDLGQFDGVVTCNDITVFWGGLIDAAVSFHPEKWPHWITHRANRGMPAPARVIGHDDPDPKRAHHYERAFPRFPGQTECGSSGLFALKVALVDLGFDRAVLCGIPMDARPHFFSRPQWDDYKVHRTGWEEALPQIKDRARSMSGWTMELLGRPTERWLSA